MAIAYSSSPDGRGTGSARGPVAPGVTSNVPLGAACPATAFAVAARAPGAPVAGATPAACGVGRPVPAPPAPVPAPPAPVGARGTNTVPPPRLADRTRGPVYAHSVSVLITYT
jgi:hypothetical protein